MKPEALGLATPTGEAHRSDGLSVGSPNFWGSGGYPTCSSFLEIFAGEAGLSKAVEDQAIPTLMPIELLPNSFVFESTDVLIPGVLDHIKTLISQGWILGIHFGTPCSSFSLARKDDGGPPPLRSSEFVMGLPGLRKCDQDKVDLGNALLRITVELAQCCFEFQVPWTIENPLGSYLWKTPAMIKLVKDCGARRFELDMCRYGSPHMKPTAIVGTVDLAPLALRCDSRINPHKHEPLVGVVMVDGKKVFKTKAAQVYPQALCAKWAKIISRQLGSDPLAKTFQMSIPASERKRALGQPMPWKPHKQRSTASQAITAGYQMKKSAVPPLLEVEMEPGQAVQVALDLIHPFSQPAVLPPDLQEALSLVVKFPTWINKQRELLLAAWESRAIALMPLTDEKLMAIQDPYLRRLLRGVDDHMPLQLGSFCHVCLWDELLKASKAIDKYLLEDMVLGFPIVGHVRRSYRWALLQHDAADISLQDLQSRAWEFSAKVKANVAKTEVTQNTQKIWESTLEDVKEGSCLGPFYDTDQVSELVGSPVWIPTQRFEVVQKNKVRGVDSATTNGVNMATRVVEKIELPSTDLNVSTLRWLKEHGDHSKEVKGWVLDERKAYRQIPILPQHRRWSVITLKDPSNGKVAYFVMVGHSFGLVAAVYNYNRRSAAISDILRRVFHVAAFNFYDDKYGFEPEDTIESAFKTSQQVHRWLGAAFDEKKLQISSEPTILGVTYDLVGWRLLIKESRKEELSDEIDSIVSSKIFSPGQAGKLRGKLMFGASQLWGKIGRAFLRALSERQYSRVPSSELNPAISACLRQWKMLINEGPPRPIESGKRRRSDFVVFTDGSFPDGSKDSPLVPWVGGVIFAKNMSPIQFGCEVEKSLIDHWLPRKSQIALVELFATIVAMDTFRDLLKDSWSLLFVDSEPVQGALVKGYSSREDMCELVGVFWQMALELKVNIYIDRVSTDANPADPPSRDRMEIGRSLGWLDRSSSWPKAILGGVGSK